MWIIYRKKNSSTLRNLKVKCNSGQQAFIDLQNIEKNITKIFEMHSKFPVMTSSVR